MASTATARGMVEVTGLPTGRLREAFTYPLPPAYSGEVQEPVRGYRALPSGGLGLPYFEGLRHCLREGVRVDDRTTRGAGAWSPPRLPDPDHPSAPAGQRGFFEDVLAKVTAGRTAFAVADTGTGKTAAALYVAGRLGLNTLVIVPRREIARQWKREALKFLGLKDSEVLVMDGPRGDLSGVKVAVAVVNSMAKIEPDPAFENHFGFEVADEADVLGAREFSRAMGKTAARYRLAMTATESRRDGMHKLFFDHYGPPSVRAAMRSEPLMVLRVPYRGGRAYPAGMPAARVLNRIAEDPGRNALIARIIGDALSRGWDVAAVGDRIGQLQILQSMAGRGSLYTGKMKAAALAAAREGANPIFATRGMLGRATDIPRLSFGVETTPGAKLRQLAGRFRRPCEGAPDQRVFVVIEDDSYAPFTGYARARLKDIAKSEGVTIKLTNYYSKL